MDKTDYVIEKNIPLPTFGRRTSGLCLAISKLQIGESVFAPNRLIGGMAGYIINAGMRDKCVSRTVDGGVRIWRIK